MASLSRQLSRRRGARLVDCRGFRVEALAEHVSRTATRSGGGSFGMANRSRRDPEGVALRLLAFAWCFRPLDGGVTPAIARSPSPPRPPSPPRCWEVISGKRTAPGAAAERLSCQRVFVVICILMGVAATFNRGVFIFGWPRRGARNAKINERREWGRR